MYPRVQFDCAMSDFIFIKDTTLARLVTITIMHTGLMQCLYIQGTGNSTLVQYVYETKNTFISLDCVQSAENVQNVHNDHDVHTVCMPCYVCTLCFLLCWHRLIACGLTNFFSCCSGDKLDMPKKGHYYNIMADCILGVSC